MIGNRPVAEVLAGNRRLDPRTVIVVGVGGSDVGRELQSHPHGVVSMLLLTAWGGAEASKWIDGASERWGAGLVLAWAMLGVVIVLWNRPRLLAPPHMRGEPGVIRYRRASRGSN